VNPPFSLFPLSSFFSFLLCLGKTMWDCR
jgi:hypothetical protein